MDQVVSPPVDLTILMPCLNEAETLAVCIRKTLGDLDRSGVVGEMVIGGIAAARGRYVIMGESDDSDDFSKLDAFVAALRQGWQLVMGNRFLGGVAPGAMPPLHRYLGNPVRTATGRILYGSSAGDFHCGLRGSDRAIRCGSRSRR